MTRRPEPISPDLTPLIDMIFLLLVFFMAISSMEKNKTVLTLALPEIQTELTPRPDPKNHVLEITNRTTALDGLPVDESLLAVKLLKLPQGSILSVYIDKECRYGRIALILSQIRKNGTVQIDLVVEPSS